MEMFFFGLLVGAGFMLLWNCVCLTWLGERPPIAHHHIDIAESNRQAALAYVEKRQADHAYAIAAMQDD